MDNRDFLNRLSQKLNTGNRRSILLNAIPGPYNSRIDLTEINEENTDTNAQTFLNRIFDEDFFDFTFSTNTSLKNNKLDKKLHTIYYQDINNFLEQGVRSFGFGFPLLITKNPKEADKYIAAPLFIWKLELEKSPNSWIIKRDIDNKIVTNDVLISNSKSNDVSISEDVLSHSELELLNKDELVDICKRIGDQLDFKFQEDIPVKSPARDNIINSKQNKWISWSGVFGLYSLQRQSISNDLDEINSWGDELEINAQRSFNFQTNNLSGVETDPSQEQIINTLSQSAVKVIQGPPGTGKSQSLSAIITNALVNGAKCLVVCEKKTALDVIYRNLERIGLQNLCVVIDDPNKDRNKVVKKARSIIDNDSSLGNHREKEFKLNLHHYQTLSEEISNKHHLFLKKTFGDDNFKNLINRIIQKEDSKYWTQLSEKFSSDYLEYNFDKFQILSGKLKNCLQKYQKLNIRNNSLDKLHNNIFINEYSDHLKEQIITRVELTVKTGNEFRDYYRIQHNKFGPQLAILNQTQLKKLKRKAIFSKQKKELLNEFTTLDFLYSKCEEVILNEQILQPTDLIKNGSNLDKKYNAIEKNISSCQDILPLMVKFEAYHAYRQEKNHLSEKEKQILEYLITLPAQHRFSSFEKWYLNNYLTVIEREKGHPLQSAKPLKTLIQVNKNLKDTLKEKIQHYWETKQRKSIQKFIDNTGNIKTIFNLKQGKKAHFSNSLRKIAHNNMELFTDIFPVLLMNPVSCSSILPMDKDFFEFVIFDEASQLRLEDTIPAFLRGKIKIVSGDSQQMPPSSYFMEEIIGELVNDMDNVEESADLAESESLLDFAESLSASSVSYLDFHYRSRHPGLINFSNAAFYNNRLVPMPEDKGAPTPIQFFQLNGKNVDGTNLIEAKRIVKILFSDIKKTTNNIYPSVGIVTMNIKQRNLIWEEINKYALTNKSASNKLNELEKSGLFVKNLENIQGDERDIIIISTTYGINEEGLFRQNFGPIGKTKGYRLLNVIITRAKHQVYVCTSISKNYYSKFRTEIENSQTSGKGILYAYLSYAEAISSRNNRLANEISKFIKSLSNSDNKIQKHLPDQSNENNILDYIFDYVDADRIVQNTKLGGISVPLIIKSPTKNLKYVALEIEGDRFQLTSEAYLYDIYRQYILNKLGFKVYYIWLYNWWKNPKKEALQLNKFLQEEDERFYNN